MNPWRGHDPLWESISNSHSHQWRAFHNLWILQNLRTALSAVWQKFSNQSSKLYLKVLRRVTNVIFTILQFKNSSVGSRWFYFFYLIFRQLGAIVFTLIPLTLQRVTAETCRFSHFLSLQKRVRNPELKTKGWRKMKFTQTTTTKKKMLWHQEIYLHLPGKSAKAW